MFDRGQFYEFVRCRWRRRCGSSGEQRRSDLLAQFESVVERDQVGGLGRRAAVGQAAASAAAGRGRDAPARVADGRPVVAGSELRRVDVHRVRNTAPPVAGRWWRANGSPTPGAFPLSQDVGCPL